MALGSQGQQLVLSSLPYEYRKHLDRIVHHVRGLYPELNEEWDGLVSNAARAMAEDVRGWLVGLSKYKEVSRRVKQDTVEVFEKKGDEAKKVSPKGKGKEKDKEKEKDKDKEKAKERDGREKERDAKQDDTRPRSRPTSPSRAPRRSKLDLDAATLDWLHSRIDATLLGGSRIAEPSSAPSLLLLTFPPYTEARTATQRACIWERSKFSLPLFQDEDDPPISPSRIVFHEERSKAELLFPVSQPPQATELHKEARIVGGTFRLKGTTSAAEDGMLRNVVRIAVYTSLSLLLESTFLHDLSVSFASTPPPSPTTSSHAHVPLHVSYTEEPKPISPQKHKHKASAVWNFLTGRSLHVRRSCTVEAELDNHTLIPARSRSPPSPPPKDYSDVRPPSARERTLSFLTRRPTTAGDTRKPAPPPIPRFQQQLSQLANLPLSTSPSVKFPPSALLLHLRQKEAEYISTPQAVPLRRARTRSTSSTHSPPRSTETRILPLSGFHKAALRSLRGADETLPGWLSHQGLTVLYSRWVHQSDPSLPASTTASSVQTNTTTSSSVHSPSEPSTPKPEEPKKPDPDRRRALACIPPQWRTLQYYDSTTDRELEAVVKGLCSLPGETGDAVCTREKCEKAWIDHRWGWACADRRVEARLERADDAGSEGNPSGLQVWAECEECRQTTDRQPLSPGASMLSFGKYAELLIFSSAVAWPSLCDHTRVPKSPATEPEKAATSRPLSPIMHRFLSCGVLLTLSVRPVAVYELRVPRLQIGSTRPLPPLEDTQQRRRDNLRREIASWFGHSKRWMSRLESELREMKRLPHRPRRQESVASGHSARSASPSDVLSSSPMSNSALSKHLSAASAIRTTLHSEEGALYNDLKPWSTIPLNDVRRRFKAAACQIRGRMEELEALYGDTVGECTWDDPSWWKGDMLVLPGSWVMFKEEDVGAIISYTLSSEDYRRALEEPLGPQPTVASESAENGTADASSSSALESWSAVITRRDNPRDVGALLTMQVLGPKRSTMNGTPPKPAATSTPPSNFAAKGTPKDAWAPADVAVSYQAARGDLNAADELLSEKLLQDMDASNANEGVQTPDRPTHSPPPRLDRTVSVNSVAGQRLLNSMTGDGSPIVPAASPSPSHAQNQTESSGRSRSSTGSTLMQLPQTLRHVPDTSLTTTSSTSSPTPSTGMGTLGGMVSYLANTTRSLLFGTTGGDESTASHLPLLAVDRAKNALPAIEEKPHLRYDFSVGKKLKFSCTVYYAQQFEALRRLCGVQNEMIESLAECVEWKAEGGKSRSRFFKSKDDRYIIKTLVNAWHVSDLQVLLDVSPILFRYIESLGDKPSTLAKLLGFYSLEMKNSDTSAQTKVDVLVMENLFYNQKPDRQYDLKGIEGRRSKAVEKKTLFDVEFLESQKRDPIYMSPHSRLVVRDAIRSDAAFLTSSNIMDYSMLLGVNDREHIIACGLVDTIGSYNVAKTLEYTAKQSLKSGKDVTVMPPAEYEARFVSAMESYLIACPDKWTKTGRNHPLPSNVTDLPAVL